MQELINQIIAGTVPNEQVSDNDLREIALHYKIELLKNSPDIVGKKQAQVYGRFLLDEFKLIPKIILDRLYNIVGSNGVTSDPGPSNDPLWHATHRMTAAEFWGDLAEQVS